MPSCLSYRYGRGVFPLSRASEEPDELEEERRLAYVGITGRKRFFPYQR
ncbi:MAG: 3'-5' exonuclease [Streptococcus salivarius]